MKASYDLVVIGAGPAGLAAATQASELGLEVLVLDEQSAPGGQIYRAVEAVEAGQPRLRETLGDDYARGEDIVRAFRSSKAQYLPNATVWNVSHERIVNFSVGGGSREVSAGHIIVATGALERPVPIPGWTLPGVMSAGALQILLKSAAVVPDEPAVLAGSGPLLWLLAQQLVAAGAPPAAIVETVPWGRYFAASGKLLKALNAPSYLTKGLAMMRAVKAAGVPIHRGASALRVEGKAAASALVFSKGGCEHSIAAKIVALHQGVIPNQQISRLIGATHDWNAAQHCFYPRCDEWFSTDIDGVSVAGDGGGIGGAFSALQEGRIAACGATHRLGRIDQAQRDRIAAQPNALLKADRVARPFLDALYAPPKEVLEPADDVTVCRCEEVSAGAIREAVAMGCPGPNQAKSYLRCGMGPCQGRLCGPTVTSVIAEARGCTPEEIGYYRIRPPLKPLTLGELATLEPTEIDQAAQ